MRVQFRPAALDDLTETLDHIALDSPAAALRVVDAIENACLQQLTAHPRSGRRRDDLCAGLRVLVVENHRICYIPHVDRIEVVRVLHAARDARRVLRGER